MEKMELMKSLKDNLKLYGIVYTSKKEKSFIDGTMQERLLIRANGKKETIIFQNDFLFIDSSFNSVQVRYEYISYAMYRYSGKYSQLSIEIQFCNKYPIGYTMLKLNK